MNKTKRAQELGISRRSLYYKPKRESIDTELKIQIESVLNTHPSYGHRRIAIELKLNKKRILRIMHKYCLHPRKRRNSFIKPNDLNRPKSSHKNLIGISCAIRPGTIYVSDFTYIKYQNKFIYLATVVDQFTREIIGVHISRLHDSNLILKALINAIKTNPIPKILHSDQGSEYTSKIYDAFCKDKNILISMSHKGSPWENGYQESLYNNFKLELRDVNRFENISKLIEAIYLQIYYYNYERIHTKLKTSPIKFKQKYLDRLCKKMGT